MTPRARMALLLAVAGLARLVPIVLADRVVADVQRYQRVAAHVLDVSWNPYEAKRLYPYPPVWVWIEAGSEWLARRTGASFAVLVKLPVLAADLAIVALLYRSRGVWTERSEVPLARLRGAEARSNPRSRLERGGLSGPPRPPPPGLRTGLGLLPAWLYALHPVSVLIGAFHGQFDAVALLFVLLALLAFEAGRRDASALALSAAIALKSFPVLLLPVFLLGPGMTARARARFAALAVLPVVLLLVPYAVADFGALRRELFGYGGVADFGWIGFWRGLRLLHTGVLTRSEASYWGALVPVSKLLTVLAVGGLFAAIVSRRVRWSLPEACLAVLLAFLVFYGSVSAQYLLWVVPFGALWPDRFAAVHGVVSTMALFGFYSFLAPAVLYASPAGALLARPQAGVLWVVGTGSVLLASVFWLADLTARGLARRKAQA